jgi:hypothetical protein
MVIMASSVLSFDRISTFADVYTNGFTYKSIYTCTYRFMSDCLQIYLSVNTFMNNMRNLRKIRGLEITKAKEGQVSRIDSNTYKVLSQSGNGEYVVCLSEDEWRCECPDHRFARANHR